MAKHTPGQWTVETPMGDDNPWIVEANKQPYEWRTIAIIPCEGKEDDFPIPQAQANARLIAAAPELLEALEELRNATDEVNDRYIGGSYANGRLGEAIEKMAATQIKARAAIRKATQGA